MSDAKYIHLAKLSEEQWSKQDDWTAEREEFGDEYVDQMNASMEMLSDDGKDVYIKKKANIFV